MCVCVRSLPLCVLTWEYTRERDVKRKMTQEGRGVRARKRGQKGEQREEVVVCGCAACRSRGCGLKHLISGIHTAFT